MPWSLNFCTAYFSFHYVQFYYEETELIMYLWGQVRFGTILENGTVSTKNLAKHSSRAHKMAIEPGSPRIFYSCGEDGVVRHVCTLCLPLSILCKIVNATFLCFVSNYITCLPPISYTELRARVFCNHQFKSLGYVLTMFITFCSENFRKSTP